MGITKSEIFTTEQNQLAALAKTFGHPARLAILLFFQLRTVYAAI